MMFLLCSQQALAMDTPAIIWTKYFYESSYAKFYDVHETSDGGFIVAGAHLPLSGGASQTSIYRFSTDGDLLWTSGGDGYTGQSGYWVEELSDGSFIAAGGCGIPDAPTQGMLLLKTDSEGNQIWSKCFDLPDSDETGYCVLPLEDGGFAVCGELYPMPSGSGYSSSIIIKTDSLGNSLWTTTLDLPRSNSGRRVVQIDNYLVVYVSGYSSGTTRLIWLSPEDGEILHEASDFPLSFGSIFFSGDMTVSSTDEGFTFVTSYFPQIAHTDETGNLLWYLEIPYWSQPFGYSINNTMDGGYIYGGENTPGEEPPWGIQTGMVVKFDSEGIEQWRDYVYETHDVQSIRQLSSGGYIACGGCGIGTLIRYEPETGIDENQIEIVSSLSAPSPNPFSSSLNIQFNLDQTSVIELSVYDLSGRLIEILEQDSFQEGEHSFDWTPGNLSSGCYLIRLSTPQESFVRNCVFLE